METNVLIEKVEKLSEPLKKEVEDFVDFLLFRKEQNPNKSIAFNYNDKIEVNPNIVNEPRPEKIKLKREPGGLKGKIWISDDFDEPLEEFKDYR